MKLGLVGYGRMGTEVEKIASLRDHKIVAIVKEDMVHISDEPEVYIDFSTPEALDQYILKICEMNIPMIIGTTGWYNKLEKYEKIFLDTNTVGIWSGNFSLGVNLFWKLITKAIDIFDNYALEEYDVFIHEFHHKNKIDSPSGTALQIGQIILDHSSKKNTVVTDKLDRKIKENELHISSTRGGSMPGTHSVIFDSDADTIDLTHIARGRSGFALGSILAAEKIKTLKPGLHSFKDVFDQLFSRK